MGPTWFGKRNKSRRIQVFASDFVWSFLRADLDGIDVAWLGNFRLKELKSPKFWFYHSAVQPKEMPTGLKRSI